MITTAEATQTLSGYLAQSFYLQARFLKEGDIIERHSRMFVVAELPQPSAVQPGHVVFNAVNEQGGIESLSVHGRVEVPLFDQLNDEEARAVGLL